MASLESCARLGFIDRQLCAIRLCRRAELHGDPQCVERRRADDERQRRMQQ